MNILIAFLRGINVSGQKKIKMDELKNSLLKAGLKNVCTYIQSGNVIFETPLVEMGKVESLVLKVIRDDFGFDVPVVIKTPHEIQSILNNNPFRNETNQKALYFALLHEPPMLN